MHRGPAGRDRPRPGRMAGSWAAAALAALFFLLPGLARALTLEQRTLQGLKGVYVVVEEINLELEPMGLTSGRIKRDIEERLHQAGIRVLSRTASLNTPGRPYLYVRINAPLRPELPICAFAISVELRETVKLARGPVVDAAIWSTGASGSVGRDKINQIRTIAGDQVDRFINDYREANRKP